MLRFALSACVFLVTLVACVWATVAISRGPIESDLATRTLEALEEVEGFRTDLCEISFEGRDGHVIGEVKSDELRAAAEGKLKDLYGARVIETEFVVRPYDAPWIMVERRSETEVFVRGLLSDETESGQLVASLEKSLGEEVQLNSELEVRDKVEPAEWLAPLIGVASKLIPSAEGGEVELRNGKLSLRGELPDAEAEKEVVAAANQQFAATGVTVDLALTVAPPPEPSGFELFPPKDGEIIVAGRLARLEDADELLKLLRSSGNWIVKDQIVVDENTTPAPWVEALTFLLPSVLGEVADAGVKIAGSQLRLEGQLESEGMFVAIGEVAQQNFPAPDYEIQNRLRVVAPPREAMVSVVTFPDGRVQLKGLLSDAALKERIVDAVRGAIDGGELLADELQVDANVTDANWIDALVQLIPPYVQRVKRGGLTIFSDILAVEAVIESDADRDAIWAMTEQHFPDETYQRLLELRFPEEVEGGIASEDDFPEPE